MTYKIDEKNKVLRAKKRGHYDKKTVYEILDAGLICQVGITLKDQPFVIPMAYSRIDNAIILHGALNSRICKSLETGVQACVNVTLVDGLVLARATFSHSINYRSVVAFGTATLIKDDEEKLKALNQIVDFLTPGRNSDARGINKKELHATSVIKFVIEQASAKIRMGDPKDNKNDLDRDVWAGVIPIKQICGDWIPSADLKEGIDLPKYKNELEKRVSF